MIELSLIMNRNGRIAIIADPARPWERSAVLNWRDVPEDHAAQVRDLIASAETELGEVLPENAEELLLGREPFFMQWAA